MNSLRGRRKTPWLLSLSLVVGFAVLPYVLPHHALAQGQQVHLVLNPIGSCHPHLDDKFMVRLIGGPYRTDEVFSWRNKYIGPGTYRLIAWFEGKPQFRLKYLQIKNGDTYYPNASGAFTIVIPSPQEYNQLVVASIYVDDGPCPADSSSISNASPGPLEAGLACDISRLQDSREVVCAASVSGQRRDARIEYAWTFDGQNQNEKGSALALTGMQQLLPGVFHIVTVVANDVANQISSNPVSRSFSDTAGQGSGGSSVGPPALGPGASVGAPQLGPGGASSTGGPTRQPMRGKPNIMAPLTGGSWIAIAAAVAVLALINAARGRGVAAQQAVATIKPPVPQDLPEALPPGPRPATPHEVLPAGLPKDVVPAKDPSKRKRKTRPPLHVELIVGTSIRTASTSTGDDVQIWGDTLPDASPADGGDALFAGYRLTVTPADWSIVLGPLGQPDIWSVDGGRFY